MHLLVQVPVLRRSVKFSSPLLWLRGVEQNLLQVNCLWYLQAQARVVLVLMFLLQVQLRVVVVLRLFLHSKVWDGRAATRMDLIIRVNHLLFLQDTLLRMELLRLVNLLLCTTSFIQIRLPITSKRA